MGARQLGLVVDRSSFFLDEQRVGSDFVAAMREQNKHAGVASVRTRSHGTANCSHVMR